MPEYELYNPQIIGSMKTTAQSENSLKAAEKLWGEFSQHTNKQVYSFPFSIKNVENGKISHFLVSEDSKDEDVNYSITKIEVPQKDTDTLENKVNLLKGGNIKSLNGGRSQYGGSDSDSSSSDSEPYNSCYISQHPLYGCLKNLNTTLFSNKLAIGPIEYVWYAPFYKNYNIFIPTFQQQVRPFVELYTTNWYLH